MATRQCCRWPGAAARQIAGQSAHCSARRAGRTTVRSPAQPPQRYAAGRCFKKRPHRTPQARCPFLDPQPFKLILSTLPSVDPQRSLPAVAILVVARRRRRSRFHCHRRCHCHWRLRWRLPLALPLAPTPLTFAITVAISVAISGIDLQLRWSRLPAPSLRIGRGACARHSASAARLVSLELPLPIPMLALASCEFLRSCPCPQPCFVEARCRDRCMGKTMRDLLQIETDVAERGRYPHTAGLRGGVPARGGRARAPAARRGAERRVRLRDHDPFDR